MSDKFELTKSDWKKQGKAAVVWSAPVLLMYLSAVLGVLQVEGHTWNIQDLIPSSYTVGGIIVWALSQVQGIILRWVNESK